MVDTLRGPTSASTTEAALVKSVIRLLGDLPYSETHSNTTANPATSLTVASDATSPARFQVGDYLDWVDDASYDIALVTAVAATALTVTAAQLGSTAAAHAASARFRKNPRFFGIDVQKAVNDALQDLYPRVYSVYETQLSPSSTWSAESTLLKEIDATAQEILFAYQKTDNTPTRIVAVKTSQPFYADSTLAATHKKVIDLQAIRDDNNTIFVQYLRSPAITDLTTGAARAVEFGAAWRLLASEEAKVGIDDSIRQAGTISPGGRRQTSSYYRALQSEAIADEERRLNRFARRQTNWQLGRHYA